MSCQHCGTNSIFHSVGCDSSTHESYEMTRAALQRLTRKLPPITEENAAIQAEENAYYDSLQDN